MNSISPNLNLMIKSCEKVSKVLIRDFGEVEKLQVSIKGPKNFVTNFKAIFSRNPNYGNCSSTAASCYCAYGIFST